jgi:outer membrane lipoprotein-sorting protein
LQVTKRVSQGKRDFRENGRFFFYLPGKMRWEYDSDPKKVIVSDGATLWMLEPAESGTQVLKTSLNEDTL